MFVLYYENDKELVMNMINSLKNTRLSFYDIDSVVSADGKVTIVGKYDYFVIVISEALLKDYIIMRIILDNFYSNGNSEIIPLIIGKEIYEPEEKSRLVMEWKKRKERYLEECFDYNFNGDGADELKIMDQIYGFISGFITYATNRDIRSNLGMADKLVKYIEYDLGETIKDKKSDMSKLSVPSDNLTERSG